MKDRQLFHYKKSKTFHEYRDGRHNKRTPVVCKECYVGMARTPRAGNFPRRKLILYGEERIRPPKERILPSSLKHVNLSRGLSRSQSNIRIILALALSLDFHRLRRLVRPGGVLVETLGDETVCEVRPGPEYLLRWHYYSENGTFRHNTYVYKDDGCSKPVWSRCVKGRYGVRGRSLHMPDASQADFTLQEVMVMVYSGTVNERDGIQNFYKARKK
ncbi:unnamed protein product [Nesidiocoris tenuis]|uniref:APCDD1 domain-containing protein n=1 Tax=Nesidiocoris tenuis TaxID=355587 RepID=A0A6H5G0I5_9HEMI|nr:unnamed protein product [Nesidiocoris tenuis]